MNIDDCPSSNCHHFSTCQDGINNYTCICGPRYTGRHCDTFLGSLCGDSPCLNGGVCKDTNDLNNYTCACTPGYTGRNCSIKVTPCSIDPCLNNGLCKVAGSSNETFECDCPTGECARLSMCVQLTLFQKRNSSEEIIIDEMFCLTFWGATLIVDYIICTSVLLLKNCEPFKIEAIQQNNITFFTSIRFTKS